MKYLINLGIPIALAILASCSIEPRHDADKSSPQAAPQVTIDSGTLKGVSGDGVEFFKGIPYAAAPVGDLRWREPQPVPSWSGVKDASDYGADCMQEPFPSDAAALGTVPAEDCLYLNIWRPTNNSGKSLPVVVWIHGGGFVNGGASPAVYDGSAMAKQGVIFVGINYRLGRFGFFAHPALSKAGTGKTGNYGYLDQIAALQWVRRNIATLGGDPESVTIMGESAGGRSVTNLMLTPLAEGLFHRAIIMSGGGRGSMGSGRRIDTSIGALESAEQVGRQFAAKFGIEGDSEDTLQALRALSAEQVCDGLNLVYLFQPPAGKTTYAGGPLIDDLVVPASSETAFKKGKVARVPLMIGTTSMDIGFAPAPDKASLFASYGGEADLARELYDPDGTTSLASLISEVGSDRRMHEPAQFVAAQLTELGQPVWLYRFAYVAHSMRSQWAGAPHATDIPFFLNTVDAKYDLALTPEDKRVADMVSEYVINFVKTGSPSGGGLPPWTQYEPNADKIMNFKPDGSAQMQNHPLGQRMQLNRRWAEAQ